MTPDGYLQNILTRESVDTDLFSPIRGVQAALEPTIREWAGNRLLNVSPSGSFAKGTANLSGTDIDLFISLSPDTVEPLKEIYSKLFNWMNSRGYSPRRQNVSINVRVNGYDVDLVPGKRQDHYSTDHSLYRRRADTWMKTNVATHVNYIRQSGRASEIRILKLWRNQKGLDFPSFYLELTALKALIGRYGTLAGNVWQVLEYLRDNFVNARVLDPANTNNIVSDDLTIAERLKIKAAADKARQATNWGEIVK